MNRPKIWQRLSVEIFVNTQYWSCDQLRLPSHEMLLLYGIASFSISSCSYNTMVGMIERCWDVRSNHIARQLFYHLIFRQVKVGTGMENNTRLREILNTTSARLRDHQKYYWYQDFALDHADLRLYPPDIDKRKCNITIRGFESGSPQRSQRNFSLHMNVTCKNCSIISNLTFTILIQLLLLGSLHSLI